MNLAASHGDDSPNINHDFQASGEQGSVVIIYPGLLFFLFHYSDSFSKTWILHLRICINHSYWSYKLT